MSLFIIFVFATLNVIMANEVKLRAEQYSIKIYSVIFSSFQDLHFSQMSVKSYNE